MSNPLSKVQLVGTTEEAENLETFDAMVAELAKLRVLKATSLACLPIWESWQVEPSEFDSLNPEQARFMRAVIALAATEAGKGER